MRAGRRLTSGPLRGVDVDNAVAFWLDARLAGRMTTDQLLDALARLHDGMAHASPDVRSAFARLERRLEAEAAGDLDGDAAAVEAAGVEFLGAPPRQVLGENPPAWTMAVDSEAPARASTGSRTAGFLVAWGLSTVPAWLVLALLLGPDLATAGVVVLWTTGVVWLLKQRQEGREGQG